MPHREFGMRHSKLRMPRLKLRMRRFKLQTPHHEFGMRHSKLRTPRLKLRMRRFKLQTPHREFGMRHSKLRTPRLKLRMRRSKLQTPHRELQRGLRNRRSLILSSGRPVPCANKAFRCSLATQESIYDQNVLLVTKKILVLTDLLRATDQDKRTFCLSQAMQTLLPHTLQQSKNGKEEKGSDQWPHHCVSHGMPSPSPSIVVPGQLFK